MHSTSRKVSLASRELRSMRCKTGSTTTRPRLVKSSAATSASSSVSARFSIRSMHISMGARLPISFSRLSAVTRRPESASGSRARAISRSTPPSPSSTMRSMSWLGTSTCWRWYSSIQSMSSFTSSYA